MHFFQMPIRDVHVRDHSHVVRTGKVGTPILDETVDVEVTPLFVRNPSNAGKEFRERHGGVKNETVPALDQVGGVSGGRSFYDALDRPQL